MMMRKFLICVTVLLLTVIGVWSSDVTKADAKENSIGFGFCDDDTDKVFVVHRVKNNETLKLHRFQTLVTDEPIADYNVVGYGKHTTIAGFGGRLCRLFFLGGVSQEGRYTIELLDSEGNKFFTFYVEIVEDPDFENDVLRNMESSQKAYLVADKDGTVKEIFEVTASNNLPSTVKIASLDADNCSEEPKYKSIKSGKSKVLKIVVDTYDSISEAKKCCSLSKKSVKKLKAGKKVSVKKYEYDLSFAFSYQGYYFGRSTNVTDAPPSSGTSSNSLNQ